jgi:hypothetical protein
MKIKRDYLLTILATLVLIWVTTNPLVRLIPALFTSLTGIFILSILLYILLGEIVYSLLFVVVFLFGYQLICLGLGLGLGSGLGPSRETETFVSSSSSSSSWTWSPENVNVFKKMQDSMNRNTIFDTKVLQDSASREEVEYFIQHGEWPWSPTTEELYKQGLDKNSYMRNLPDVSVKDAKRIYNQNTILDILSNQSKEGQFLLHGITLPENKNNKDSFSNSGIGSFGISSGLDNIRKRVVQCSPSPNSILQLKEFVGYDGITGVPAERITNIKDSDVEKVIPGFSFVNGKGPCNPCSYQCPFDINVSSDSNGISNIWKQKWNL